MAKGYNWRKGPRIKTQRLKENGMTEQLSFQAEPALKESLIALSYVRGDLGAYANITRMILTRAVRDYIDTDLTPEERAEYERTLVNVRDGLKVSRMKRQERKQERQRRLEAHQQEREDLLIVNPEDLTGDT